MSGEQNGARRVLRLRPQPKTPTVPPADTLPRAAAAQAPKGQMQPPPGWAAPSSGGLRAPAGPEGEPPLAHPAWAPDQGAAPDGAQELLDLMRRQRRRTSQVQEFWEELT